MGTFCCYVPYLAEVSTEIVRGLNNTRNLWRFLLLKKILILRKKLLYYSTEKSWTIETYKEMLH